jgi:hypothetical protein
MSARQKKVEQLRDRRKANALELLRERFCLPALAAVIQRGSSESSYELKLEDGRIVVLGTAYEIHQQAKVRARLFDANAIMPKHSTEKWDEVLRAVREIVEVVETMTEAEELRSHVLDAVSDLSAVDFADENKSRLVSRLATKKDTGFYDRRSGVVYLSLGAFVGYLNFKSGRRWTRREVVSLLTRHGFAYRQKAVRYTEEDGQSKVFNAGTFWTSPENYYRSEEP